MSQTEKQADQTNLIQKRMMDGYINRSGHLFSFIPKQLIIEGKPEYSLFPFNVMIARYKAQDNKTIMGTVIYEPDLSSFNYNNKSRDLSMTYFNRYNHDYYLVITVNMNDKRRVCTKYFTDNNLGESYGGEDWNNFFIHVGFLGLANGEMCRFD